MQRVVVLSLVLGVFGCTVNAPPAQDISGDNLNVEGGKIVLDENRVPVVAECAEGQVVQRGIDEWTCVEIEDLAVTAGAGIVTAPGPGAVTVSVDFGPGATQVATGADLALVVEGTATNANDIGALQTRAGAIEAENASQSASIDGLETRPINDLYVDTCDDAASGGLGLVNGALAFCDGTNFRPIELGPPPPGLIIAAFDRADYDATTKVWPSSDGSARFFMFDTVVRRESVDPPVNGPKGVGASNNGAAAGSSVIGHARIDLPERDFSIEVTFEGSDTVFTIGDLRASLFGGGTPEVTLTELGRSTRWTDPTPPAAGDQRHHLVYVHGADDSRQVYLDGEPLIPNTTDPDAARLTGPRLDKDPIFKLGSDFGAGAGGGNAFVYFNLTIHGHALDASEVDAACAVQVTDGLLTACPPT